jgi:hypothetical protein
VREGGYSCIYQPLSLPLPSVEDESALTALGSLACLHTLNLSGNPISLQPECAQAAGGGGARLAPRPAPRRYVSLVTANVPSLTSLDDEPVADRADTDADAASDGAGAEGGPPGTPPARPAPRARRRLR